MIIEYYVKLTSKMGVGTEKSFGYSSYLDIKVKISQVSGFVITT